MPSASDIVISNKNKWLIARLDFWVILTIVLGLFFFFGLRYMAGTLGGNVDWHILPSGVFGPPKALQEHGFTPIYTLHEDGGWDGQQYYYAANDILDKAHTSDLLDGARAIRYQRIGLGIASFFTSRLVGHDWISPRDFLYTNIFITFAGLIFLLSKWRDAGISLIPAILLFVFPGIYLSVFNGLLDAPADSLFIIFVITMIEGRKWAPLAFISGALCVLTREAYFLAFVLFAGAALVVRVAHMPMVAKLHPYVSALRDRTFKPALWQIAAPAFAAACFSGWVIWLRLHFGYWPSSRAGDVVDNIPLRSLISNIYHTLIGTPRVVPAHRIVFELGDLLIFSGIMLISLAVNVASLRRVFSREKKITLEVGVMLLVNFTGILFFILYCFFGNTVMEHYTGYLKPLGLLFFSTTIGLIVGKFNTPVKIAVILPLVFATIWADRYLYIDRFAEQFPHHYKEIVSQSGLNAAQPMSCFSAGSVTADFKGIMDTNKKPLLRDMFNMNKFLLVTAAIDNKSDNAIEQSADNAVHPMFVIGEIKGDRGSTGWKSVFRSEVSAHSQTDLPVLVEIPANSSHVEMRLIVSQPGCERNVIFTSPPFSYKLRP